MMPEKFKGLIAAAYTPMRQDGSLAPEVIPALVDYAVRQRFAGLFVNGSTGEFTALTMKERQVVAAAYLREAAGRIPVVVNIGACCAADSIELAQHASSFGAEALCLIAPFYFRPANVRDLADFVKEIAPACQGRPLYLYHAPSITGVRLPLVEFLEIMLEEVPNFSGVKYTDENLCEFARCAALSGRLQMLFGRDEMLLGALAMGAEAAIGTTFNYLPKIYHGILDAFEAGDLAKARSFMVLSHRAVAIAVRYGLASIKTFMKFAGIDVGPMRSPVGGLSAARQQAFRLELSEAGLDEYIG